VIKKDTPVVRMFIQISTSF